MLHSQRHPPAPELFPADIHSPPLDQSAHSSRSASPTRFRPSELQALNAHLETLSPIDVLDWAVDHLPNLYQTTKFDVNDCAITDMFSNLSDRRCSNQPLVVLIFIDTLYHLPRTLELAHLIPEYYNINLYTFYPPGVTHVIEFEALLGTKLWETDQPTYDFLTKVEPARRANEELGVKAIVTGRLQSRVGDYLPVIEIDESGLVKVNPLATWNWEQTWDYVKANNVPCYSLSEVGDHSIGDWHSTTTIPLLDERLLSDRWRKSNSKPNWGIQLQGYRKLKSSFEKL
ncbi:hypothetical protein CROQUDRAFT_719735 [Cronartium quercuum f. sp. fusiforme G11]|uniref:Phosphoadenosine phosphosulphate reductase domain-containing protein n=1 Tax=Cronartium quercuum f. sp. fusiforme G11 TaxID=708437 RepID=A0A9P6NWL4_9BASI|nr:hypothetical protein CROQUDRAFT_719735 [Cronartium quercuum f. sp. fusiforme G11]